MNDYIILNSQDREHLLFTIEESLKISQRFQFFLWAQGALQGLILHETLLCAYGDMAKRQFKHELFSDALLDSEVEQKIVHPVHGLLPRLIELWLHDGGKPCLFHLDAESATALHSGRQQLGSDLQRCGFDHVAAHGVRQVQSDYGSFFVFIGTAPHSLRAGYLLELLMPYLHAALHRILADESSVQSVEILVSNPLSMRERQVLQWVRSGKSNKEIAHILGISPLTVKNHVHKILRKLKVSNRAQAVGLSTASRLFSPDDAQ